VISITILSSAVVLVGQSGNDPDEVLMQNQRFAVLWIALGTFILVGCAAAYAELKAAYAQVNVETDRAAG